MLDDLTSSAAPGSRATRTLLDHRAPGDVSYCCAGQYCKDQEWQPGSCHRGGVRQVETLALITSDAAFLDRATVLRTDYSESGSTD